MAAGGGVRAHREALVGADRDRLRGAGAIAAGEAAALVDRLPVLLLPLLVVIVPATRLAPAIYRWRIRAMGSAADAYFTIWTRRDLDGPPPVVPPSALN